MFVSLHTARTFFNSNYISTLLLKDKVQHRMQYFALLQYYIACFNPGFGGNFCRIFRMRKRYRVISEIMLSLLGIKSTAEI